MFKQAQLDIQRGQRDHVGVRYIASVQPWRRRREVAAPAAAGHLLKKWAKESNQRWRGRRFLISGNHQSLIFDIRWRTQRDVLNYQTHSKVPHIPPLCKSGCHLQHPLEPVEQVKVPKRDVTFFGTAILCAFKPKLAHSVCSFKHFLSKRLCWLWHQRSAIMVDYAIFSTISLNVSRRPSASIMLDQSHINNKPVKTFLLAEKR